MEDILPHNMTFEGFEVAHDFPAIGRRRMLLNAWRLYQEHAGTEKILLAIEDITGRQESKEPFQRYKGT